MIIALEGVSASGKTTILQLFKQQYGSDVLIADECTTYALNNLPKDFFLKPLYTTPMEAASALVELWVKEHSLRSDLPKKLGTMYEKYYTTETYRLWITLLLREIYWEIIFHVSQKGEIIISDRSSLSGAIYSNQLSLWEEAIGHSFADEMQKFEHIFVLESVYSYLDRLADSNNQARTNDGAFQRQLQHKLIENLQGEDISFLPLDRKNAVISVQKKEVLNTLFSPEQQFHNILRKYPFLAFP